MGIVVVQFGRGNVVKKDFPEGTTVGQVLADPEVVAWLGMMDDPRRYDASVGGVKVGADEAAPCETPIVVTVKHGTK